MGRMIINEKLEPKKVQIGAKTVNSSALLQCGLVNALLPQQLLEAIWNPIFPTFSFIIILLCMSQSFFLSALSLPHNEH
jgi:hypothetical protein